MTKHIKIDKFWQRITAKTLNFSKFELSYAYIAPENARAAITIVNGRCESYIKYQELVYDLYHQGFAVFVYDHLGQGNSSRLLKNPEKGHIDSFTSYTDSLNYFVEKVALKHWSGKHFLLAHSMGAAISYLYLAQYQHPFERAILSAPMFGIPTNGIPLSIAKLLTNTLYFLGFRNHYFFGQENYSPKLFESNQLMQSETRYNRFIQLYKKHKHLRLGGVTTGWLKHALDATLLIKETEPTIPTLLMQAEKDTIVLNCAQDELAAQHDLINKVIIKNSLHEILFEKDEIRNFALAELSRFFKTDLYE